MSILTPCKINLHLGIHTERDERGYHCVDSLMVPVALCDEVTVSENDHLEVYHTPALEVSHDKTTVWAAATLLAEELGREPNVRVEIKTQIPERAGLGGSSADAGATLRSLAALWGVHVSDERVVRTARRVGADVAFFLDPQPGLYLGAGDVLAQTFAPVELFLALVMPVSEGGSTKETYAAFDAAPEQPISYAAACEALASGSPKAIAAALYNNLAPAAARLNPEIAEVTDWLAVQPGVLGARVTGSGACSFAICETSNAAERIAQAAQTTHSWQAWATKTVGSGSQFC